MPDQAYDLRRLATHCERVESPRRGNRPALLVVTGGKGGVGTTTVALNLAAALARNNRRAVFVDADPRGGDAALICGIEERHSLSDVLADRRTWDEASCAGPNGIEMVAGQRGWCDEVSPIAAADQLVERLDRRDLAADVVVLDAGNVFGEIVPHVCREANAVLLVTTSDAASVVRTFAAIKTLVAACRGSWRTQLYVLVNMTTVDRVAETTYYRLARTCRRVLGIELQSAGHLPMATTARKSTGTATIGLNLQLCLADTVRRVAVAEAVLN